MWTTGTSAATWSSPCRSAKAGLPSNRRIERAPGATIDPTQPSAAQLLAINLVAVALDFHVLACRFEAFRLSQATSS
jgi:hypothetical protein